jgi:hypothetical protein
MSAVCVGCLKTDQQTGEYDADNRVEDDGTFLNGKFVCTECYVELIPLGLDIGPPSVIQARIKKLMTERGKLNGT